MSLARLSSRTAAHISKAAPGISVLREQHPDDVVIVSSLRTAVTRSYKGGFKDTYHDELLSNVLRGVLTHSKIDPALVDDVIIGNVLPELGGSKVGRMAACYAGLPHTTSFATVNRACASSLQAITTVAASISTGMIDVGIGGGVESMTQNYGTRAIPQSISPTLRNSTNQEVHDSVMPMGMTSENVASGHGITRERQDAFALESHTRAGKAQKEGRFEKEIVPVTTRFINEDKETGKKDETEITVSKDDGVRAGLTIDKLQKLKPVFKDDGSSTAGNSSQISDGASATLLMRRDVATRLGYKPIAKFLGSAVAGVPPRVMGIGPAYAIPRLYEHLNISNDDVDLFELNEAFASQALFCMDHLKLDAAKVNVNGGAIALGHPLGATGGRMIATLVHELARSQKDLGVASMCIGTGMGMAAAILRE